ncbi:hypothetical protein JVU11DRAFT_7918 [Chiua virens]|nr:hypothetical protein JVU11DRAFT_7918 [Chiua virens]
MSGAGFDPLLVSEFTRDPIAERDSVCQRTSCQASVRKGQPYIYIGTKGGKPGRYVCAPCYRRYQVQPDTVTISRDAHAGGPDMNAIQRSISAAHSRSISCSPSCMVPANNHFTESINPPAVVPVNQGLANASRGMPPPPPLQRRPEVRVPSAAWESPDGQPVALWNSRAEGSQNALGYNPNHKAYAAEHNYWANRAYGCLPVETITLSITALHETGKRGRQRGTPFGNICEGVKDVDARLTAPKLRVLALSTLVPCVQAFCPQFPWRTDEFIVRDEAWVDLAKYSDLHRPYFYDGCFPPNNRKGTKGASFKTKICGLNIIVPQAQWLEYEAFKEELESNGACKPATLHTRSPSPGPSNRRRSLSPRCASFRTSSPPPRPSNHLRRSVAQVSQGSSELSLGLSLLPASRTVSSVVTKSPPVKPPAPPLNIPSPNQKDIKEALKSGGAASLNVEQILKQTTQLVDFHPIPTLPFTQILKPEHRSFNVNMSDLSPGQIRVDQTPRSLIGVGGFKTAQAAQLILSYPLNFGLGSRSGQSVVAKRPYIRQENLEGKPPFPRYVISDELDKLFREANVLYWAKALLSMTYTFVDCALAASDRPPIFDIPRLRFVEAGLALGYANTSGGGGPRSVSCKAGSVSTAYLVEELIPDAELFVKFIHNGSCLPLIEPGEPEYNVAEFLAFTQHVQYVKTGGLAYISDYQGSTSLLTDPQILTHPSVGEGSNIFSEGNLEKGVEEFENEHICNKYCKWPGFSLATFQSGVKRNPS